MIKEELANSKEGVRYNEGKNRMDLLEPWAIEKLAEVFTIGAIKYAPNNWLKGMPWSKIVASLERHLSAYKQGIDYDKESGLLHAQHLAWNAMALLSYYRHRPEYDDRLHSYFQDRKVGIDIDGVIADFNGAIHRIIGKPDHSPVDWEDPNINKVYEEVRNNEDFWLNLRPLVSVKDIPFQPHCYITSRSINPKITQQWLHNHGFADVPLYCVKSGESKVETALKSGVDYFIDDYYKNFIELNKAGVCTFLLSRSWNSKYDVGFKRIKDFNDFKERFL